MQLNYYLVTSELHCVENVRKSDSNDNICAHRRVGHGQSHFHFVQWDEDRPHYRISHAYMAMNVYFEDEKFSNYSLALPRNVKTRNFISFHSTFHMKFDLSPHANFTNRWRWNRTTNSSVRIPIYAKMVKGWMNRVPRSKSSNGVYLLVIDSNVCDSELIEFTMEITAQCSASNIIRKNDRTPSQCKSGALDYS